MSAKLKVNSGGPAGGSALERASPPMTGKKSEEDKYIILYSNSRAMYIRDKYVYVCMHAYDKPACFVRVFEGCAVSVCRVQDWVVAAERLRI